MNERAMPSDEQARAVLESWLADWYAPAYRTARLVLGNHAEAEDAVQDAFLRLWRFRDSIPEGEAARAWLYRVVVNACFSRARTEGRQRATQPGGGPGGTDSVASRAPGPEEAAEEHLQASVVRGAIAALPEQLRVPVVLRYFSGLSEREIGVAIQRRPGTVKSRLHEAKRRLEADPALAGIFESEAAK